MSTPKGIIVFYSGSINDISPDWALCDGTNGTPDLRDKFIIGAGSSYVAGAVGGSKDAVVISHDHNANMSYTGSHRHTTGYTDVESNAHRHEHSYHDLERAKTYSGSQASVYRSSNQYTANTTPTHSHSIGVSGTGFHSHSGNTTTSGEDGADKNLPPYYALAYIKKIA